MGSSNNDDDPSREVDDEGQDALLAQLEEAFSSDQGGHEDRAKVLETIQVCSGRCVSAHSAASFVR